MKQDDDNKKELERQIELKRQEKELQEQKLR